MQDDIKMPPKSETTVNPLDNSVQQNPAQADQKIEVETVKDPAPEVKNDDLTKKEPSNETEKTPGVDDKETKTSQLPTEGKAVEKSAKKQSTLPIPALLFAGVVCLALIGLAVYTSMNNGDSLTKKDSSQKTNVQKTTPDVQGALDELGQLPAATEDQSNQLSDSSLGL